MQLKLLGLIEFLNLFNGNITCFRFQCRKKLKIKWAGFIEIGVRNSVQVNELLIDCKLRNRLNLSWIRSNLISS